MWVNALSYRDPCSRELFHLIHDFRDGSMEEFKALCKSYFNEGVIWPLRGFCTPISYNKGFTKHKKSSNSGIIEKINTLVLDMFPLVKTLFRVADLVLSCISRFGTKSASYPLHSIDDVDRESERQQTLIKSRLAKRSDKLTEKFNLYSGDGYWTSRRAITNAFNFHTSQSFNTTWIQVNLNKIMLMLNEIKLEWK